MNGLPEGAIYVDRIDKVIVEGDRPRIEDFMVTDFQMGDVTEMLLSLEKPMVWIVVRHMDKMNKDKWTEILELQKACKENGVMVIGLTADGQEAVTKFLEEYGEDVQFANVDEIPLKAMIRSSIGIVSVQQAVVKGKWSSRCIPDFEDLNSKFDS